MLLMILGIAGTVAVLALWALTKENDWSKLGYAMCVFTMLVFFFVLAFVGNAYGESEPAAAIRGGLAFLFATTALAIVSYRVLIGKMFVKKSAK